MDVTLPYFNTQTYVKTELHFSTVMITFVSFYIAPAK